MFSLMEVFGSLMILFVIVIFSHRLIKRNASKTNEETPPQQDTESTPSE